MNPCPICGKAAKVGYITCGNSYCQEASYYRQLATNSRKRRVYHLLLALVAESARRQQIDQEI